MKNLDIYSFLEKYYNIKLYPYQKLILKAITEGKKFDNNIHYTRLATNALH